MQAWLEQVLSSKDFWINVSVAALFFIGGKGWGLASRTVRVLLNPQRDFTLTGFWIGDCRLPNCEGYYVEIWKLAQRGSKVEIRMFSYSPEMPDIEPNAGTGVVRGAFFSALYYSCKPDSPDSGVMSLRVKNQELTGGYAQFDSRDRDERFFASNTRFTLNRITLSFAQKLKMILGRPPFENYDEADRRLQRTRATAGTAVAPVGAGPARTPPPEEGTF
jgi:hypothetical protein